MAIKRVGIVGSGIMGSGIAEVAAKAGIEVVLRSRAQSTADAMVAGLEKSLAKQVERGKLEAGERDAVLGRVRAVTDLGELRRLRPRASSRSSRTSPRRSTSSPSSTASAPTTRSSRPTRRRCRSSRWRWRPAGPTRCAASTSSTRRR